MSPIRQTLTKASVASKPAAPSPATSWTLQRTCACGGSSEAERKLDDGTGQKTTLQRSATDRAAPSQVSHGVHDVLRSTGQPLEPGTRGVMERWFGRDFSQVRIHSDARAAESARAVNATAYTVGRDLVFGTGEYAPRSPAGRQLIAHELTHVIQQASGAVPGRPIGGGLRVGDPDDAYERQADATARQLHRVAAHGDATSAAGPRPAALSSPTRLVLQRQPRRGRAAPPVSRGPAIVEDGQPTAAGQMARSAFLTSLRAALLDGVDAEFRQVGRTGRDCPYVLRTIERYANRPLSSLMRLINAFARPPAGADAQALIRAVTQRAQVVARRIAQREAPRAQAATERGDANLPPHDPAAIRAQLGGGRALDVATRDRMERSFGTNFESVRIHDDSAAARFSMALGARAFTIGQDIAFSAGHYLPGTPRGDVLLAHELAHTIQQGFSGRGAPSGPDLELERQADRAASATTGGPSTHALDLRAVATGLRIQRAPVVLAGALIVAEATPEVVVGVELASVTTEVVVVDGALTVGAETAAPALFEAAAPVLETAAPALETAAPAVAPAVSSTLSSAATTAVAVGAATTLSSDSGPTSEESDRRQRCRETHPTALQCDALGVSQEEAAVEFLMNEGYQPDDLLDCQGISSFGEGVIDACDGAPGQSWHCGVRGSRVPLSIFACLCCAADGSTSWEWRGPHWSTNLSRRGR